MRPWLWLIAAAFVFLALWGWRELGMRASNERLASRDAEIRRLQLENETLRQQIVRVNRELATAASIFTVTAPANVSARVMIDPQQRGFLVMTAPPGSYDLTVDGQTIAKIDVSRLRQKTMMLDHLPPQNTIKSFAITSR